MNDQQTLTLELTLDEINSILTALGDRPYVQVYQLVQNIQQQAEAQVAQQGEANPSGGNGRSVSAQVEDPS